METALALLRTRTGSDYVFLARTCGIPEADGNIMDAAVASEVQHVVGQTDLVGIPLNRVFLAGTASGLGFQSVALTSPAAQAASWHACLPHALRRLNLQGTSALISVSPWAQRCLPQATQVLRAALGDDTAFVGDDAIVASQHMLASAPLAAAALRVSEEAAADPHTAAAMRSAGGPGASGWLQVLVEPSHHMTDAQCIIALRARLHMDLPQCSGRCQHQRPDGSICGAELDAKGKHARSCAVGGWLVRRHDNGCAALAAWCEDMGCTVHREVVFPNSTPDRPEARMDLVIHAPHLSEPVHVDVTIVSALAQEAMLAGAARRDGAAAGVAARRKRAKYPHCNVLPFVVEDHGRFGEEALALVRSLAPVDNTKRSPAIRRLYQTLGSVLQRHAADSVVSATTARRC